MNTKTFSKGEVIFREGDESSEAYRLLSGDVEISISTKNGPNVLAHLSSGAFFGEMSLIDDKPRSASATAVTDCRTEVFDEANFNERVLGDPGNLHLYLTTVFDRLRRTGALLQQLLNRQGTNGTGPATVEALLGGTSRDASNGAHTSALHLTSLYEKTGWKGKRIDVEVTKFPFRIGRASDGHGPTPLAPNDLTIADGKPFHISRNHCIIEKSRDGLVVRDFGSTVGTIVNGIPIGTAFESFVAPLHPGENTVILGGEDGPHHFIVQVGQ